MGKYLDRFPKIFYPSFIPLKYMESIIFNKKTLIYFSIYLLGIILVILLIPLNSLLYDPMITPNEWLNGEPCRQIGDIYICQISSTIIVFSAALVYILVGLYFIKKNNNQLSRIWIGITLILMGAGAAFAGISYQMFGYELKCSNQEYCLWTNWFELCYMILTVAGANAILITMNYVYNPKDKIVPVKNYCIVSFLVYNVIIVISSIASIRFLLSFEFMLIYCAPNGLMVFLNILKEYKQKKDKVLQKILRVLIFLVVIIVIYYGYYMSGVSETLWEKGIWFNQNDVLHILLIMWLIYLYKSLKNDLKDYEKMDN